RKGRTLDVAKPHGRPPIVARRTRRARFRHRIRVADAGRSFGGSIGGNVCVEQYCRAARGHPRPGWPRHGHHRPGRRGLRPAVLAVVVLHEPCTVLQVIGGAVMLAGAFITQQQWSNGARKSPAGSTISRSLHAEGGATSEYSFIPRRAAGYLFASLAALAYGVTSIMARTALEHVGAAGGILGGLIAYIAATAAIAAALVSRPSR